MDLEQVTDLHNRRSNVELVSRRAKAEGIPFLVWPEDKLLLRLSDLPRFTSFDSKPKTWKTMETTRLLMVGSDKTLREMIREGFGYDILFTSDQIGTTIIREWRIESR